MTQSNYTRRLLDAISVSTKLGQPHDWFDNYRGSLEDIGFPKPTLPADQFGAELWDEHAIDCWLDSRMDGHLRENSAADRSGVRGLFTPKKDLSDELAARARSLSL